MSHSPFGEKLGPWLDGELSEAASRDVAVHVRECEICRNQVEEMRRLSTAIRQLDRHPMPADLKAALMTGARGRHGSPAGVTGFRARGWILGSAAVAAGIVLVLVALRPGAETNTPMPERPVEIAMKQQADRLEEATPTPRESGDTAMNNLPVTAPPAEKKPAGSLQKGRATQRVLTREKKVKVETAPEPASALATDALEPTTHSAAAPQTDAGAKTEAAPQTDASAQSNIAAPAAPRPIVARFETQLILAGTQAPMLGPIVPSNAVPLPRRDLSELSKEKSTDATARAATPASGLVSPGQVQTRMVFLLHLDNDGHVLSVDPIGARVVSPERVRMVQDLLAAATLPPRAEGDPTLVTVEVLVTEGP